MRRATRLELLAGVGGALVSLAVWCTVVHLFHTSLFVPIGAAGLASLVATPVLLRRLSDRTPVDRTMSIVVALLLAIAGLSMLPAWARRCGPPLWGYQRRFDRNEWLARHRNALDDPRGEMVADLTRPGLILGRTRAEVRELLGPPSLSRGARSDEWIVGMWSGFRIDADGMVVDYDVHGRAESISTVQH